MKAKLLKETEKAVQVTYCCEIYGEQFTVKSAWIPKSQIEIQSIEGDVLNFNPKNDWILDAKTKDYCKFVKDTFKNVVVEVDTYLSNINSYRVEFCWV